MSTMTYYLNWATTWETQGYQGLDLLTSFFSDEQED